MNTYTIDNNKTSEKFEKQFKSMEDARHWVINTLDLSKEWNIFLLSEGDTKKENDKPEMFDERIQALGKYLDLNNEDLRMIEENGDYLSFDDREFLVLTDDEADEKAKEYIKDSAWAFNASFLASHSKADEDVFICLSEKCESSNDAVLSLIDDFDHFAEDAIASYGRGHFMSSYDGQENIEEVAGTEYYIYRTN